jgi:ABC-type nitrate/sulfonate/bicarbonate transport system substrate-binding protein
MTTKGMTRRQTLVATGAGVLAAGFGLRPALAETTVKQGYQTNMWGMPTYYLLHSGHLEKHGIKAEEFAVPSGNSPCNSRWRAKWISAPMPARPSSLATRRAA